MGWGVTGGATGKGILSVEIGRKRGIRCSPCETFLRVIDFIEIAADVVP